MYQDLAHNGHSKYLTVLNKRRGKKRLNLRVRDGRRQRDGGQGLKQSVWVTEGLKSLILNAIYSFQSAFLNSNSIFTTTL